MPSFDYRLSESEGCKAGDIPVPTSTSNIMSQTDAVALDELRTIAANLTEIRAQLSWMEPGTPNHHNTTIEENKAYINLEEFEGQFKNGKRHGYLRFIYDGNYHVY